MPKKPDIEQLGSGVTFLNRELPKVGVIYRAGGKRARYVHNSLRTGIVNVKPSLLRELPPTLPSEVLIESIGLVGVCIILNRRRIRLQPSQRQMHI